MDPITTALIAIAAFAFILYRQFVQRPVSAKDILIPLIGGLYLGDRYLSGGSVSEIALTLGASAFGVVTGLLSGFLVRVWQDTTSGVVYQRGGWGYLAVLLGLVAVRIALRVLFSSTGLIDSQILNDAFIGMAVGAYAGRAITVGLRALVMTGWDPQALPTSAPRQGRRARSW